MRADSTQPGCHRRSALSPRLPPANPARSLSFLPLPLTSGMMSDNAGGDGFFASALSGGGFPRVSLCTVVFSFRTEKTWQLLHAWGQDIHRQRPRAHRPPPALAPTSEELLFLGEALALPVTDLPPVVRREPLHRQLQVLLLLGQEVPVLRGRRTDLHSALAMMPQLRLFQTRHDRKENVEEP